MPNSIGIRAALIIVQMIGILAFSNGQTGNSPAPPSRAQSYIEREFYLPHPRAFPHGLDVLEVRAELAGKHPLALLTHGTAATPAERAQVTPWRFLPQALWLARRGYVVLVVVRRGYGHSDGQMDQGGCGNRGSFTEAAEAGVDDLRVVARYAVSKLPYVDGSTIISMGVSTGGLVQVALAADPMPGLRTAINFAGGRGGDGKGHNCNFDGLVSAFHGFGKHNKLPMLWIYAENDHWFPPEMAERFDQAFKKGGGNNEFVMMPPDGEDGHHLFAHVSKWGPIAEEFLHKQALLPLQTQVLPAPQLPNVTPPENLPEAGLAEFHRFLAGGPFKTFATNNSGAYGYSTGQFSQDIADREAIDHCKRMTNGVGTCKVVERGPQ